MEWMWLGCVGGRLTVICDLSPNLSKNILNECTMHPATVTEAPPPPPPFTITYLIERMHERMQQRFPSLEKMKQYQNAAPFKVPYCALFCAVPGVERTDAHMDIYIHVIYTTYIHAD